MIQSLECKACGWKNDFETKFCFRCGAKIISDQDIDHCKNLGLCKKLLYERKSIDQVEGTFKLENSDEKIYKIDTAASPITIILLYVVPIVIWFFTPFFLPSFLKPFYEGFLTSSIIAIFIVVLVTVYSSHFIDIESDKKEKIGRIKSKNLISSKKYVSTNFFLPLFKDSLKVEFVSKQQANFFINDEKYDIVINHMEKTPLQVFDSKGNIIIEIINQDRNFKSKLFRKYPRKLEIIFSERVDQEEVVFVTSSIVEKCFINKLMAIVWN